MYLYLAYKLLTRERKNTHILMFVDKCATDGGVLRVKDHGHEVTRPRRTNITMCQSSFTQFITFFSVDEHWKVTSISETIRIAAVRESQTAFFFFFLFWGDTLSLRMLALSPASQAGPMRNLREGTSVVLLDTIRLTWWRVLCCCATSRYF